MIAGASPQRVETSALLDQTVCRNALGQSGWDQNPKFSEYVAEATRRGLTVNACRQMLGPANIATSTATAPASSAQPAPSSGEGISDVWVIISILATLLAGVGLVIYYSPLPTKITEHAKRVRALNEARELAYRKWKEAFTAEFPFIFSSGNSLLCMDRQGERLRFVDRGLESIVRDLTVPVSSIISVELSGGNEVVTDYETTSTKPNALAGALVGGLLFGEAGAMVGATAAGSEATTVATQHVIEKPSVLVFELSDLANPVVRFSSMDHAECDLWLHRVRSAMARQKGHTIAEGGSPSARLAASAPETPREGLTAAQMRAIGG